MWAWRLDAIAKAMSIAQAMFDWAAQTGPGIEAERPCVGECALAVPLSRGDEAFGASTAIPPI